MTGSFLAPSNSLEAKNGSVPVVSVLLRGEAAAQHPADGLLSTVHMVLKVLSLRQLPHELTLLLQQGDLEGRAER